jgi:serine-type D-Ala-D-Ala carboxypeptidase/endopeptidase
VATIDIKPALDCLLAPALDDGVLAPETGGGLVIGILDHGVQNIYCYGTAKPNSIFEIGSITKVVTGLALAQMAIQKKVDLEEPVRELLPAGAVPKPNTPEITLLDLVTQNSGLPRLPGNLQSGLLLRLIRRRVLANPYVEYDTAKLLSYIHKHGLAKPARTRFAYSNLGFGLLGFALAQRAGLSFEDLIRSQVTLPLGLADTVIQLSPEQRTQFIPGHNIRHKLAQPWDFHDAMAGCGALHSTAPDLLRFLDVNLHPEKCTCDPRTPADSSRNTLPAALALSQEPRADAIGLLKIAFAWLYQPGTGDFWHNGGTGGYSAQVAFNRKQDLAIVVLYNRLDLNPLRPRKPRFTDLVYADVLRLLSGRKPVAVEP